MTITELQNQIQQKALELPPDLLQEVYDYMEFIVVKSKKREDAQDQSLEKWWGNLSNFSDDYMKDRIQPPLDKSENLFE
ncbi:DUF2281 domain-containing protein [Dyadobacter sp. CY312]|uniref:DUF2281 domain-containing protein n=1 Tax=Dyadobacter sp. CY312 TaxID=2907303 RepID=UPI001F2DC3E4|nr:DUF2281 domain-containing protein [Dyadobacter sp. CY312]MCE7041162.1 DUF2281 domain-containing protein [Dyadobacter sp. CY312]